VAKHAAKCPKCGQALEVDTAVGGVITCPRCQASLTIAGKAKPARPADPLIGRSLGEFEIVELLGRGGMGAVYKGRQPALERFVAIKTLPRSLAANRDFVARFRREARTAANLRHTHLVQVYAVGEVDGIHYIAMEFVDGEGLNDVLRRDGPLPPARALELMKQTAAALAVAHDAGIVHRDIKPSNLMIDADGSVRVTDFGLAKRTEGDVAVTHTGQSLGTPLYMSPEVAQGEQADARSDLYSLGAAFYHLLAGQPPFLGRTPAELIVKHATETPRPLGEVAPRVDRRLTSIIDRLLRKNPDARYASAHELLEALEGIGRIKAAPAAGRVADVHAPTATLAAGKRLERQFAARKAAERRRAAKKRTTLIAAVASGALLVVLALVAWLATRGRDRDGKTQAVRPPATSTAARPTKTDPRERGADTLYRNAAKAAALGKWRTAASYLDRLDKDYSNTKSYAANRSAIATLRKKIDAKLKPPTKPTTKEPPQPQPHVEAEGEWVSLFDGKSLGGWKLLEEGVHTGHGEVRADERGMVLERGKPRTGVGYAGEFPRADYEVELEFNRVTGGKDFCYIQFPVGSSDLILWFVGWNSGITTLTRIDGKGENATSRRITYQSNRWYRVGLKVTEAKVEVWLDQRKIIDFATGGHKLNGYDHPWPFVVSASHAELILRHIRLRRLGPEPVAATRFFHGAVRRLADGRVELHYDWSDAAQLRDWEPDAKTKPTVADGELRMGARLGTLLTHGATLVGDVEVAGTWCMREKLGMARSCVVGVCRGDAGGYGFMLITVNPRIWKGRGDKPIAWGQGRYEEGQPHTFRLVRASPSVKGWIDGAARVRAQDADYGRGAAFLSSWEANVAYDDIRIVGRLDPEWLKAHPDAAKQVAAAPLAGEEGEAGWTSLFDGKSLDGWKVVGRFPGAGKAGTAKVADGRIVLEKGNEWAAVACTREFPADGYEVEFEAMRIEGKGPFGLTIFPIGGSRATLEVGGWGGSVVGIAGLDGKQATENETTKRVDFENGRWYRLRLRVAGGKVALWIDGKPMFDLARAGHRFGLLNVLRGIERFGVAVGTQKAALRGFRLRRLGE